MLVAQLLHADAQTPGGVAVQGFAFGIITWVGNLDIAIVRVPVEQAFMAAMGAQQIQGLIAQDGDHPGHRVAQVGPIAAGPIPDLGECLLQHIVRLRALFEQAHGDAIQLGRGQLIEAGEGTAVEIALGNKVSLERIGLHKQPLRLRGTVRAVSDGAYTVSGPIYTGQRCHMGRTVCLDTGAAQIVITEQTHEPWDLGVFHCVGMDPTRFRFVLLKSRMYCRPVFVPLSAGLVECDSPGVTTSDYSRFPFARVSRPVFPLDAI